MKNIFIAIGGSGTKVAEALVRMLGIGFPIRNNEGVLTSAGEQLEIWRVDSDASSGASDDLQRTVEQYQDLQNWLDVGWGMNVMKSIRHLNPLDLPKHHAVDNVTKTLRGILNSAIPGRPEDKTQPLIDLFYTSPELNIEISRGFYQKPFIGASVMAVYAESLRSINSASAQGTAHANLLQSLQNQNVRFFLCGTLQGGTGASGVSVFGKLLKEESQQVQPGNKWQMAACLLAPYFQPPSPFKVPQNAATYSDEQALDWFAQEKPVAANKFSNSENVRAFRQIATGFYADTKKLVERAKYNLAFYDGKLQSYFDQIYIIGKPRLDDLDPELWSNGGTNQRKPLNSAEVIAATSALRFFAGTTQTGGNGSYIVASSHEQLGNDGMALHNMPHYEVDDNEIAPEAVVLATVAARFLVVHEIQWETPVGELPAVSALKSLYEKNPQRRSKDPSDLKSAGQRLREFMEEAFESNASDKMKRKGWLETVWRQLSENMPVTEADVKSRKSSLAGVRTFKTLGRIRVDPAALGHCSWIMNFSDFHTWSSPDPDP